MSPNGVVMPDPGRLSGWRKPTPGLGLAERHAQAGEGASVPRSRAFTAVKRVGAHLGLKAGDMLLLDTLGAFTQTQDWEEGRRPIVWASNAYLMEQTGFSLSALKRHARRLAEAGAISFRDSPNGKRWGRRDAEGVIVEAYGFDLSPLAARAEEFEALQAALQAERRLCQRLKRQITISRRTIRARIEAAVSGALSGPWAQLMGLFEDLLARLPARNAASESLARLLSLFGDLQADVEVAFLKAVAAEGALDEVIEREDTIEEIQKTNPRGAVSEPHILITNQPHPVTCNSSEKEEAAGTTQKPPREPSADPEAGRGGAPDEPLKHRPVAVDLPTLMQACPEFASWARDMGGYLKDWGDLYRVAGQLRPMIGVSEHAWLAAQEGLGKQAAAAALALVFDKHAAGEVASPGGYLRGMVEKAGAGELHIERSLYGRLSARAA